MSDEPTTTIRLIEVRDAAAIAEHRLRDATAFAPWEPAQPAGFRTVDGQARRIEQLLQASIGYWIGSVFQHQGHAGRAVAEILAIPVRIAAVLAAVDSQESDR